MRHNLVKMMILQLKNEVFAYKHAKLREKPTLISVSKGKVAAC